MVINKYEINYIIKLYLVLSMRNMKLNMKLLKYNIK